MLRADLGSGDPGCLVGHRVERLQQASYGFEKGARFALKRGELAVGLLCGTQRPDASQGCHDRYQDWAMSHGRRLARGRRFRTSQTWAAVLTHEPMQSRAMSSAFALAGTLVLFGGCSQGEGDRCEISSDCSSGLTCSFSTDSPHNGICSPTSSPGSGGSTGQDAAGGSTGSAADAGSDGPVAEVYASADGPGAAMDTTDDAPALLADAASDDLMAAADAAASVDTVVAADDATVGEDTSADAEVADSLSATD